MIEASSQNAKSLAPKKKRWWSRFFEDLIKSNQELVRNGCKT
jgi:hypothetical protein